MYVQVLLKALQIAGTSPYFFEALASIKITLKNNYLIIMIKVHKLYQFYLYITIFIKNSIVQYDNLYFPVFQTYFLYTST